MIGFYFYEYFFFFCFFFFVIFVSCTLFFISYFFIVFEIFFVNFFKNSKYECGFEALKVFKQRREIFDVKFFLVGVLFIIFDLEIIYLLPWAVNLFFIGFNGLVCMHFFLFIMALGFVFEYKKGALVW